MSWTRPDTLRSGETLEEVLLRAGLDGVDASEVIGAAAARDLDPRRLRPQMPVEFVADSSGAPPREIVLKLAIDRRLRVTRDSAGAWTAAEEILPWTTDTVAVRGVVMPGGNLYTALAGSPATYFPDAAHNELIWNVARVYAYRVEMHTELRAGDSVYALVERDHGPEGATRVRRVLAARLFVGGKPIEAIEWGDDPRTPKYFDALGKSLVTTFLRAPLDFPRVTSIFSSSRRHPILKTWRAHRGTDYGAASGTPVQAVSDGTVLRAVYNPGGFGNLVEIRHNSTLVTRYAHLRAFARGIRGGTRVSKGEIIGYVGATGLATAPHLHFEVLVNGVQRDSRNALPRTDGKALPESDRAAFAQARAFLLGLLNHSDGVVTLAKMR